ncbi:Kinesin heavy chain [Fulvia fulva]|uniref:Kinesin-like protein n=1 Tax=Passalora fulva TaxID=5499 RepID=A0A9Q8PHQ1_PASFU|nr:Kinesin heavy chain [Fulvia fulva]KAK4626844.1 Kinesin heavy chain [Fulvia fulva]KAK4628304.1 Kinesin heavy chain [Fulvia fulva]UJO22695.1 Kinesin heavy chain [Fulvia fulva]WPV14318.1 Kinesin heavy chain [Fulvia fulva]WPV29142.1 Kinesin heavy chain [Fulvia fulva]
MSTANTIKVVARFRPQNKIEVAAGSEQIVNFNSDDSCTIESREGSGAFTFDRIFPTNTPQQNVFDYSIRSTVDDVLAGYNGTVFAYGQTGSGKTFTMMGADIADDSLKGIIPRIVEQIFSRIMTSDGSIEFTVKVSYMEIYMEKIRDLLVPQNDNLPVHEDKQRGVYVKGLGEFYVGSVEEVYHVLERGGQARAVASTNMNQESSRSHSIFVIEVTQKNVETGSARSGRLFLVDLAGSEKVGKTGASGQTLEEAKKINKSLSALGMVINALSDGKSTHVPYRDSKLTRILQESLGGNSRTTLIINCSPASYNTDETISTLRFGERAKTIKQKAKVNEELSPAQLKAMLKKAQSQVTNFESYVQSLEGEVLNWRKGEAVPKDKWTPRMSDLSKPSAPPRSETPTSRVKSMSDTPGTPRPESRLDLDRASTPSIPLEKDEKEEFLKRENELQDQLAEKERSLEAAEQALQAARNELKDMRETHSSTSRANEKLQGETESLRMQVEKIEFETKEASITMDSLKEANAELTQELDDIKHQLLDAKMSAKESTAILDEKERLKKERMAQMMAGFDLGDGMMSQSEIQVREMVQQVQSLLEIADSGETVPADDLHALKERLLDTQSMVRQHDINAGSSHVEGAHGAILEQKLAQAQRDYQELLEKNLSEADVEEVKRNLFESLQSQQNGGADSAEVQETLSRQQEENARMRHELEALRKQTLNGSNGATVSKQLADFDTIKKSLMRDLQNRCERVVELEISLDSTREQYNSILRSSNSKQQQKKLAFLERNLEQLTMVQRQLVEQNAQLKKEVAIAERKLVARGERIRGLEGLVQESQEKLMLANHKFESQLMAVKERLEAAKTGSTRGLGAAPAPANGPFANNPFGRIAKPLRGGGGGGDGPAVPTFAGLQSSASQESSGNKRSSWFFNQRT